MPVLFCHWAPRSGGTRCVGNLPWRLGTGSAGWMASSLASTPVSVIVGAGSCGRGHGMRRSVSVTPQLNPLVVLQSWWRGSLLALGEASTFAHSEYIPLLVGIACRLRQVPHYASMSLSTCFPGLVLREQKAPWQCVWADLGANTKACSTRQLHAAEAFGFRSRNRVHWSVRCLGKLFPGCQPSFAHWKLERAL